MPERAVNKDATAKVTSMAPDVCLTPMGSSMVPVPYTITAHFNVAESTAPKVNYGGLPAFTMASRLPCVEGDEQGTGGGIISKVNLGYCRPVEHSGTVKAHGQHVVRQGDLMHMNCNGPDGPANTFGRIEYIGAGSAAEVLQETLHKEQRVTVDQATGKTVVEERTITRDPETGAITETRQRTEIDPSTGEMQTQSASLTTGADGARSYETASGHFAPANQSYQWETAEGTLPSSNLGNSGPVLGNDAIGTLDGDGRLYLGDGIYASPGDQLPSGEAGFDGSEAAVDEADLLSDPEYQAALDEAAQAQAEIDAANAELVKEGVKTAADVAGIFDPTPISDTVGAGLALSDGDFIGAGLSLLSWIPYLGDAVAKPIKGTRAAAKILKLTQKLEKLKDKLKKAQELIARAKQKLAQALKKKPDVPNKVPGKPKNPGDGEHIPIPKPRRFTIRESKWDYFFGRVKSGKHNTDRSISTKKTLEKMDIVEERGGREKLMDIFEKGVDSPQIGSPHVTEFGTTITRAVDVPGKGKIDIKYFYPGSNMGATPEVVSIIPKI